MADCLSCAELEQLLCDLAVEIATASCDTQVWKEGDTTRDPTPGLKAKVSVMEMYKSLYVQKKCGSEGELYEFVHVPCVTPVTCVGSACSSIPPVRNQRRYRR